MVEIIQDSIDVDCFIGDDAWDIIEAEVVLTRNTTPNYCDMLITPADGTPIPAEPQKRSTNGGLLGESFTLDVDTDLRANVPGGEVTRLFTGSIANMTPTGEYTFEAIANDPTQEPFVSEDESGGIDLVNSYVTVGRPTSFGGYGGAALDDEPDRGILVSEVVERVANIIGIPPEERVINLAPDGIDVGTTYYGQPVRRGFDIEIEFESWVVNAEKALTTATESSESEWWFDRFGVFHFGPVIPDEDIIAYDVTYITDSSAGMTTPPYRSVKVVGDGVVSQEGWTRSSLINESKYTSSGNVYIDTDEATLDGPTFFYRNMEISTAAEADHVRESLINKLKKQRSEGTITLAGFPELYPNDAIEMPSTAQQPMGGERYGINTVTHRLNNDDGFLTKVKVDGLGLEQETLYSSEADVVALSDELEEQYGRLREALI